MLKYIIHLNLVFLSVFLFFMDSDSENQPMTICKSSVEDYPNSQERLGQNETDTTIAYTLPTLTKNNKGEVVLYWTEKNPQNIMSLCYATSKDGKNYGEKKTIFADEAMGSSRLMRPRLLFKKNGDMVAVFSYRTSGAVPAKVASPAASKNEAQQAPAAPQARPKRSSEIRFTVSKDDGNTWSSPTSVDTDTTKLTRGFFDAVVLANDEIAVAYLKDVKGSTKHEERDLRMAITKKGVFQAEKLIDPVVCDCCNISLMLDNKGALNVFYRDNNDNIRDIARLVSVDNGSTFSDSKILHKDNWEINGCPHAGATSVSTKNGALITWFSGTPENSGLRLVNSDGKLLKVLGASSKNAHVSAESNIAYFVWDQTSENGISNISFNQIVDNNKVLKNTMVKDSNYGQNATSLVVNGKILVAFEIAKPNQKTTITVKALDI